MKMRILKRVGTVVIALLTITSIGSWQSAFASEVALTSVQEVENRQPTLENIQEIGPGVILNGEIGRKSDDGYVDGGDVFRLVLPKDGTLTMQFSIKDISASAQGYFDIMSGINGGYFFVIRDQTTQLKPESATACLKAGTYYIAVGSKNDTGFYYALTVAFDAAKFTDKEPDDNESQAISLAPGGAVGGNIGLTDVTNSLTVRIIILSPLPNPAS